MKYLVTGNTGNKNTNIKFVFTSTCEKFLSVINENVCNLTEVTAK